MRVERHALEHVLRDRAINVQNLANAKIDIENRDKLIKIKDDELAKLRFIANGLSEEDRKKAEEAYAKSVE